MNDLNDWNSTTDKRVFPLELNKKTLHVDIQTDDAVGKVGKPKGGGKKLFEILETKLRCECY